MPQSGVATMGKIGNIRAMLKNYRRRWGRGEKREFKLKCMFRYTLARLSSQKGYGLSSFDL